MQVADREFLVQELRFVASLSMSFIGFGLIQPLLSLYTAGFVGTSYLLVGALISVIGLVKAGLDPVSGFLSDTYGRRRLASLGSLTIAASMAIVTLAGSTAHLAVAFILYGFGQAVYFLAMMTSMVEVAGPLRRAVALGLYEGGNGASILIGTALSGPLTASFGIRFVLGTATAFFAASALACVLLVRETLTSRPPGKGMFSLAGLGELLSREYVTGMFCAFMFMYAHALFMTVMPLFATTEAQIPLGLLPSLFIGFSATNALAAFTAGPFSDRVGRRLPLALGMTLTAASFAAFLFTRTLPGLIGASLALGFGAGFFHPVASAVIADVSTPETRGKAFGFYRLMRDSGYFAGPAVSGAVSSLLGVDALFVISACLSAFGAILAIFVIKETRVGS